MPIVESLMRELKAKYGPEKGERVYYAMEASGKGPFAAGAKHHDMHEAFAAKHGVAPIKGKGKKKPPASKKRGAKKPPSRRGWRTG